MNNDIDIHELAKMIDSALSSDNPSVKSALYSFITIAALARAEDSDPHCGPFEKIFNRLDKLEKQLVDIKNRQMEEEYRKYSPGRRTYSDKTKWEKWDWIQIS